MKKNDILQTPNFIYSQFQPVDLDPCAGFDTNIGKINWVKDGLKKQWFGFVFCNPPFSQKKEWIAKMIDHGNGVLLLPERGSAPWFGPLAEKCTAYFTMGKKINFIGSTSSNNVGTTIFLFGPTAIKKVEASNLPGHLSYVNFFRPRISKK